MISLEETRAGLLRVERLNLALSAGAVATSFAVATPLFAASVAVGASLEALNFRTLHGASRRFFQGELGGPSLWLGVVGLRLAALSGALVLAIGAGAEPVALVVGLSMVVPAVVIDAWRHRPDVIDQSDYPAPAPDDPSWDRFSVWNPEAMDGPRDESDGWAVAPPTRRDPGAES